MKMPAAAAYLLKTLALNRDARLKTGRNHSPQAGGEQEIVNVASGQFDANGYGWLAYIAWLKCCIVIFRRCPTVGRLLTIAVSLLVLAGVLPEPNRHRQISVSSTPTVVQLTPTLTPHQLQPPRIRHVYPTGTQTPVYATLRSHNKYVAPL